MSDRLTARERPTRRSRLHRRWLVAGPAAAILAVGGLASAAIAGVPLNVFGTHAVGTQSDGSVLLPDDQVVAPYGQRTEFTADSVGAALNPIGKTSAVQTGGVASGAADIDIVDASTGTVLQTFGSRGVAAPVYSPDGTALYVGTSTSTSGADSGTNTILKYTVDPSTGLVTNPTAPVKLTLPGKQDFPFAFAVSSDGSTLYAVLSASNELGVIDTATMQLATKVPVGNAPAAVAVVGNEAFVSNRGGRAATAHDTTIDSAGTPIVVDPKTGASTNGTVSVVDLATNTVTDTINVGLQPTSVTVHDGSVFVANANSDTVSIIDATSHKVTQTFNVEPLPGSTVGAGPNSITFAGENTLLVSVGGDNAIAEFTYSGPRNPVRYEGLIPTDWKPDQVLYDATTNQVLVSNEYGVGTDGSGHTKDMKGTVTSFSPPSNQALGTLTSQVFANNGWDHLPPSNAAAGSGQSQGDQNAQGTGLPAIPAHLGQPSAIKHVFLIIKENRTYDQVLGDLGKGNGDSANTSYGAQVTPNLHSLSNTFTDFDNFYDPSYASPDGHSWVTQAEANDYLTQDEGQDFARSYPGSPDAADSLMIQRDGSIWNTVEQAGKTVKNYGEYEEQNVTGTLGTWQQYYADSQILEGQATGTLPVAEDSAQFGPTNPSLKAISNPDSPGFNLGIPDQYRVDVWKQAFEQQLKTNTVPNLTIMALPNDHTGGTPTAAAEVADNDLATGRIVSEISHSSVWKNSAVFVEEDDASNGVDHVDGHRAPLWIASPYVKRGAVNSSYYSQINVDKTIEQILGAQPMNQLDRAAVPMFDAFTNTPDDTPYTTLPNQVPLTQGVTNLIPLTPAAADSASTAAGVTATSGPPSPAVPAAEQSVASQWATWQKTEAQPKLTGRSAAPDATDSAQMDRYDWYTSTNWSKPYPGDSKILAPDQVPGRNLGTDMNGD